MPDVIVQRTRMANSASAGALPDLYVSPDLDERIVDILTDGMSLELENHTDTV